MSQAQQNLFPPILINFVFVLGILSFLMSLEALGRKLVRDCPTLCGTKEFHSFCKEGRQRCVYGCVMDSHFGKDGIIALGSNETEPTSYRT
jgi:hypothetical protein